MARHVLAQGRRAWVFRLSNFVVTPNGRKGKWPKFQKFVVYMLKTAPDGMRYVGMTKDMRLRLSSHRYTKPHWFRGNFSVYILSQHKTLGSALAEEAKSIVEKKTLSPHGLNNVTGGAVGRFVSLLSDAQKRKAHATLSQASKDKIALRRMHAFAQKNKALSYKGAWKRRWLFWQRYDKGLPPLPGTEYLLQEPRRPPTRPTSQRTHQKRSATLKAKYARWRAEGRPMPRPPAGSRGAFSEASKEKLAARNVRKGLTEGLHYTYVNILKCSAKAKKRHAEGRSPIPGTECFVRLQTAPTKGPKYTPEQRAEYRRVMIERVNAWLRRYAIERGWRTH